MLTQDLNVSFLGYLFQESKAHRIARTLGILMIFFRLNVSHGSSAEVWILKCISKGFFILIILIFLMRQSPFDSFILHGFFVYNRISPILFELVHESSLWIIITVQVIPIFIDTLSSILNNFFTCGVCLVKLKLRWVLGLRLSLNCYFIFLNPWFVQHIFFLEHSTPLPDGLPAWRQIYWVVAFQANDTLVCLFRRIEARTFMKFNITGLHFQLKTLFFICLCWLVPDTELVCWVHFIMHRLSNFWLS